MRNDQRRDRERLACLIEEARPRLAQILGSTSFEIEEHHGGHCSIAGPTLTLNIYRRPKSEVIDSSIELHCVPSHAVKLSHQLHTWLILKSRGEPWPRPSTGIAWHLLGDELDRVSRALKIVADDQMFKETLLWDAGYRDGWLVWG